MKLYSKYTRLMRLRQEALWSLLAADSAYLVLAVMDQVWGEERSVGAPALIERVERCFDELRSHGEVIEGTAQYHVARWLSAGWLERRLPTGASDEQYELSAAGVAALRLVKGIAEPRQAATESRLAIVIQQLQQLAFSTDVNPQTRIAALEAERDRIDGEIEAVRTGRSKPLEEDRALERMIEILSLTDDLVGDFRRVRNDFDLLHRQLREKIVENDSTRGEVLDALFADVDLIHSSDSGKTFAAFWQLLMDPEQNAILETAVDQVMERSFSGRLSAAQRRALRRLVKTLLDEGQYVHGVLQQFARSLKVFVQSRQYEEQQRITQLLSRANQAALSIKDRVAPTCNVGVQLEVPRAEMKSVAQWTLYDPRLRQVKRGIARGDELVIDPARLGEMFLESEIDWRSLKRNIRAALEQESQVSVGGILERFPARQGLATVVGYLSLGMRYGIQGESVEAISWTSRQDVARSASISAVYFTRESVDGME